jgi:hypothetical protein
MVSNMKYEILNDAGEVVNTIVADQAFVDEHYPGKYRDVQAVQEFWDAMDAASVRSKRNKLLADCDWIVIKSLELNQNIPGSWDVYRQALRDIPQQAGFPHNVTWPTQPGA